MKKVLIIRTGAIGDVVETTGLIRSLAQAGYIVDYLTGDTPAQLLEEDKDINKLYVLRGKSYIDIFKLGLELKKEKYDYIFALQNSIRVRTLCMLAEVKHVAYYKKISKLHAVQNFFDTAKKLIPELNLDSKIKIDIKPDIKEKMAGLLDDKPRICFNTGASSARQGRKWAIDNWIKLAQLIYENYDVQIFVVGSQEDAHNVESLLEKFPQIKSFVGKTNLKETAALLASANIVISGDTGPLHIASATETTCIGLFGSCPVKRSGPYGEQHYTVASDLNCSPCAKKVCKYNKTKVDDVPCMRNILPEKVFKLVDTIMKKC